LAEHDKDKNLDQRVIDGFGHEWATFNYNEIENSEALDSQFFAYCRPIDLNQFNPNTSTVADFGAGSGRWSSRLAASFSLVYALEPSDGASEILKKKFSQNSKFIILQETVGQNSIPAESLDLAMSLGVLHHIPNTSLAIKDISRTIKPGGFFLCYLYYSLENKPIFYKFIFKISNFFREIISRFPQSVKQIVARTIAFSVYLPLARTSKVLEKVGINTSNFPLHHYANMPFVMLANDALDRFGTSLEQRFSKEQISQMLMAADFDLTTLTFSESEPFWTFAVRKNPK
jgi:ubiquinone/menaquinone biosynthesis C-methylase UbiE